MSFAFHSGDSVKHAIFEELQNLLSGDSHIRTSAEKRISQLAFVEGYGIFLTEFIMNQSLEEGLRQMACVMLTKYIEEHWDPENEEECRVGENVKKMIRNILPNGLYDSNSKIRKAVAYAISVIASSDWPSKWGELFDIIVKCLGGNDNSIHGAMQVLIEFTQDLDIQIIEVGPTIITEVYRIFEAENDFNTETRCSAVQIFNSLLKSINQHVTQREVQLQLLNPVLPKFIERFANCLTTFDEQPEKFLANIVIKIEILKALIFLISDMPKLLNPYMEQVLAVVWQLLTQSADVYVKGVVNDTANYTLLKDEDDAAQFNSMIEHLLEFIEIIASSKYRTRIQNVLTDLIYVLMIYVQLTDGFIESSNYDYGTLLDDEDIDGFSSFPVRTTALDALNSLNQGGNSSQFLVKLSEALTRHVNLADVEKNSNNNPNWWKIHEAGITTVGIYSKVILEQTGNDFNISSYLNLVKVLMNNPLPNHMLGRSIWLFSQFVNSEVYSLECLSEILDVLLTSINVDKPLVLRIVCVKCIYTFCDELKNTNGDRKAAVLTRLGGYLDGILMMSQTHDTLNPIQLTVLEAVESIASFDCNSTAALQQKIIPFTITMFISCTEDPYLLLQVQEIIKTLCQNPLCIKATQEKIVPILVNILNRDGETDQGIGKSTALDILQILIQYSTAPLSDQLIEIVFPAAMNCILKSDDNAVMQSGGECLRSYIFVAPDQVCSYKNGEGINFVTQICIMLLNPMNSEYSATFIGPLIITIISKAGNMFGENIYLFLKAAISKMQLIKTLSVVMSLVMIFAYLFITQIDAILNFLTTVPGPTGEPAIQFVFSQWLNNQNLFYGRFERKLSMMALCKIFEYGITSQDDRLTNITINSVNVVMKGRTRSDSAKRGETNVEKIPVLLKIFKLLIAEYDHLRKTSLLENEEESTDDEQEINESNVCKLLSDLVDEDDDDDIDDQLLTEMEKDPLFQGDMKDKLMNFLKNFTHHEKFKTFWEHLDTTEKTALETLNS